MKYEFTTDANFITWCMTLPEVWRMGTDDSAIGVDRRMFYVNPEGNFWLQCDKYGLLMCEPIPHDAFKLHVAFAANAKGKAVEIFKGAFEWLFTNTDVTNLVAEIPSYNKLAIKLAEKSGMLGVGMSYKTFKKADVLYDQYLFKISKGDVCQD